MTFEGFGDATFAFLRDLKANNTTDWFKDKATQKRYKAELVAPSRAFVEAIGERLSDELPDINAIPKGTGSMGRINRDVRFSKDKTPYNTHLSFNFWLGDRPRKTSAGYRVWLGLDGVAIGGGLQGFPDLDEFRARVTDETTGAALSAAIADVEALGFTCGGEQYKRTPKGYDPEHPRSDLVRYKGGFHVVERTELPSSIGSAAFVDHVAERMLACTPVVRWMQALVHG